MYYHIDTIIHFTAFHKPVSNTGPTRAVRVLCHAFLGQNYSSPSPLSHPCHKLNNPLPEYNITNKNSGYSLPTREESSLAQFVRTLVHRFWVLDF